MTLISIDNDKCNHDGLCAKACPVQIISFSKGSIPEDADGAEARCIECGHCVAVCPTGALTNSRTPLEDFQPVPTDRADADQTEGLLLSRRSLRGFKKEPMPKEDLKRILEVVRRAPTASNSQMISWNMIQDPDRLAQIRELTSQWMLTIPRLSAYEDAIKRGVDTVLRGAPHLAVAYAPEDYVRNETDSAVAITYMELMAASMGYGACWCGLATSASWFVPELKEAMGVKEGMKVGGAIMLGRPAMKHYLVPPRKEGRVTWL